MTDAIGDRPVRRFPVGISATALALAWARQEAAPHGALVVVDREISGRGRLGDPWPGPAETSLACAVVVRPSLGADRADIPWLLVGLAAAEAAEAISGRPVAAWWPDGLVVGEQQVGMTRAIVQLGPGQVRGAVLGVWLDLAALGCPAAREPALEAVAAAVDRVSISSAEEIPVAYNGRCALIGRRVKLSLLPVGETRGTATGIDRLARLELTSPSGIVERVGIDQLRALTTV